MGRLVGEKSIQKLGKECSTCYIVGQERVKQLAQGRPMMMKHPSSKLITYLPVPTVLMQPRRPVQGESPGQRGEWEGGGPCGPQWGAGWPQPQTERLVTLQSLCPEWNLHKKVMQ